MSTPDDVGSLVDSLVGLAPDDAARRAADAGWRVRTLGPGAIMTADLRRDRVNLVHEDGRVTRAWVG